MWWARGARTPFGPALCGRSPPGRTASDLTDVNRVMAQPEAVRGEGGPNDRVGPPHFANEAANDQFLGVSPKHHPANGLVRAPASSTWRSAVLA